MDVQSSVLTVANLFSLRADDRQLAAVAVPALEEAMSMSDQIIAAEMARSIHADVVRAHALAA